MHKIISLKKLYFAAAKPREIWISNGNNADKSETDFKFCVFKVARCYTWQEWEILSISRFAKCDNGVYHDHKQFSKRP